MNKTFGILGSGIVGQTLAKGLAGAGHTVEIGSRAGDAIEGWDGGVGTFEAVAQKADLVIVAVKGSAALDLVTSLHAVLAGKTVIDATNPISETPPENGVLHFFTSLESSLMEQLQMAAADAHFVKAFNSVGNGTMVKPQFAGGTPSMFICGNDEAAKKEVSEILTELGWEAEDMGMATAARAIEPLCMLWCIPGMRSNDWNHALKVLR